MIRTCGGVIDLRNRMSLRDIERQGKVYVIAIGASIRSFHDGSAVIARPKGYFRDIMIMVR
jgi:hypothetical protein